MNKALRDRDYLEHIEAAIGKIQRFLQDKDEVRFMDDDLLQDAVIRNLEIIGEGVIKLSPELRARHSEVPWREIAGMRNRLIHGYMNVNLQIVWDTVVQVLPDFLPKVKDILSELNP